MVLAALAALGLPAAARAAEDAAAPAPAFQPGDVIGFKVLHPRALVVIRDIIVNVQTGTGNRIEFWNAHGGPPSRARARSAATSTWGRLTKGR